MKAHIFTTNYPANGLGQSRYIANCKRQREKLTDFEHCGFGGLYRKYSKIWPKKMMRMEIETSALPLGRVFRIPCHGVSLDVQDIV